MRFYMKRQLKQQHGRVTCVRRHPLSHVAARSYLYVLHKLYSHTPKKQYFRTLFYDDVSVTEMMKHGRDMLMMIMLMVWDYVSELRPPTGLFFIHQMSLENHGGTISSGETPDSSIRALWLSYQSYLVASQEDLGEENYGCGLRNISFILRRFL
jgi:hypothetical protein